MSAPQPITQAYQPGRVVFALLYDLPNNVVWNTVTVGWETPSSPLTNTNYQILLVDANGVGAYTAPIPTALLGYTFTVFTYDSSNLSNPIGSSELSPPDTSGAITVATSPGVVDVINDALIFLGQGTITSLTDDSEAAQKSAAIYSKVLDSALRAHYWKFATYVEIPALLSLPAFDPVNDTSGDPIPGWEYLYAYPSQCLMVRRIFDSTLCDPSLEGVGFVNYTYDYDFSQFYDLYKDILYRFKITMTPTTFQKAIAAHINPAYVEYTYRVTDTSMWDEHFRDALSFNLAARLARTLTGNTDLGVQAMQMYSAVVGEAKRLDAQEDRNHRNKMSSFQRARM